MAGDRLGFRFIKEAFELVDDAQLYAQCRTGGVRNAQSSPLLERQFHHQGVKQR